MEKSMEDLPHRFKPPYMKKIHLFRCAIIFAGVLCHETDFFDGEQRPVFASMLTSKPPHR